MYLFRLIYYSHNAVQSQKGSLQQELKSILASSQRNNPPLGVSGALIFNYQYFAQVIEGDRKAVTKIFCSIAQDERHKDIVILDASPIDQREFANWNMAFVGGALIEHEMRRFGCSAQFQPDKMTANSLMKFMRSAIDSKQSHVHSLKAS